MYIKYIPRPLKMQSHRIISCPNQLRTVMAYHIHFHTDHNAATFFDARNTLRSTRGLSSLAHNVFQSQRHDSMLKSNSPIHHICQFWILENNFMLRRLCKAKLDTKNNGKHHISLKTNCIINNVIWSISLHLSVNNEIACGYFISSKTKSLNSTTLLHECRYWNVSWQPVTLQVQIHALVNFICLLLIVYISCLFSMYMVSFACNHACFMKRGIKLLMKRCE